MSKTPKFGKVTEVQEVDDEGSTISIETNFQNDVVRLPRYKHFEYRVRVYNPQDEMAEFLKFCDEKMGKLKSNFHTETTKDGKDQGWYYVIKAWTEVVDE